MTSWLLERKLQPQLTHRGVDITLVLRGTGPGFGELRWELRERQLASHQLDLLPKSSPLQVGIP